MSDFIAHGVNAPRARGDTPLHLARTVMASRVRAAVLSLAIAWSPFAAQSAGAAVTVFQNAAGRSAWEQNVPAWETMDFMDAEDLIQIPRDLYLDEFGVSIEGPPIWGLVDDVSFPNDGTGFAAFGIEPFVDLRFDAPIHAIAADHPGVFRYSLFLGEELIFESDFLGVGNFSGLISEMPFDRVRLSDNDSFGVDDLRFGLIVPAPAPFAMLLALGGAMRSRRRAIA